FELGLSSEDLVREARDLFQRRRSPALPMEELARELRGILHKYNFPFHPSVERSL
ncbi:MAG: hypothetical protein GY856_24295, partial [bacterium]|nr:hypothetical protein [bacterium]